MRIYDPFEDRWIKLPDQSPEQSKMVDDYIFNSLNSQETLKLGYSIYAVTILYKGMVIGMELFTNHDLAYDYLKEKQVSYGEEYSFVIVPKWVRTS